MSELPLDSLKVRGYRCFEDLTIEKLARVNLIVGKNNVGKTALLEAIWIWAQCDRWNSIPEVLQDVLRSRNESKSYAQGSFDPTFSSFDYRHIFFGRPKNTEYSRELLLIGEVEVVSQAHEFNLTHTYEQQSSDQSNLFSHFLKDKPDRDKRFPLGVYYSPENFKAELLPPAHLSGLNGRIHREVEITFVLAKGMNNDFILNNWDEVVRQNKESEIIKILKILSDKVLNFTSIHFPKGSNQLIPVVHLEGVDEKVPLESLGEGMTRLLGLALALFKSKDGILLIDEIESGLHYSVLPDIWKLIFKTAKDLNVQVFATTHSKDCVEAFAEAADESPEDAMLIRLERQGEKIVAKTIEEENLALAVDYGAEVR